MKLMDRKMKNIPLLQAVIDPVLKELNDKYAPLHELKMQSKIEGIEFGLEIAAAEHKRSHHAE